MCIAFLKTLFGFSEISAQPINLANAGWKFQTGDDLTWASPTFDDSAWQPIEVGKPWESVATGYDGIGWYRRTIRLQDKDIRKALRRSGSLILRLGRIDDADETYFNGVKIGATGRFPPDRVTAWDTDRVYFIPRRLVHFDKPNLIAVRVADWGGGGGLYAGEYAIEPVTWKEKLDVRIENSVPSNAFVLEEPVGINVKLKNGSDRDLSGLLTVEIQRFTGEVVEQQTQRVEILRGGNLSLPTLEFDIAGIGFYITHVIFEDKNGHKVRHRHGFAYAPTLASSDPDRPDDFDAYWQKAKTELAAIPPDFKLNPTPQYATEKTDVFEVEMRSLGNVRVRGYYATPKGKTGLPALLHLQGYSSVMMPFDVDNPDFAQFWLNIRGHGNSRDDVNPGFPGYFLSGITSPEQYIYRGAYMDCVRAVDFLVSRPEVDTTRIAVEGGSQGGALSIATTALDKRIKFCAPDVPFLSDFRQYFDIAAWPANEVKFFATTHFKKMDELFRTLSYVDIKNHAPSVSCPVFMGVGLFDDICPPAINFAAFNNLASPRKDFLLYPKHGHSLPSEHYAEKIKWLRTQLGLGF
jgi:cephalosporin-C deacetylase-like acetyl esterase